MNINRTFLQAVENRRSLYALSSESCITDERIQEILETALKHTPSAFNSRTARVVLLKGAEHHKLWSIILESLKTTVPPDVFEPTKTKIAGFNAAYATIMFFEEQDTVVALQKSSQPMRNTFLLGRIRPPACCNMYAGSHWRMKDLEPAPNTITH